MDPRILVLMFLVFLYNTDLCSGQAKTISCFVCNSLVDKGCKELKPGDSMAAQYTVKCGDDYWTKLYGGITPDFFYRKLADDKTGWGKDFNAAANAAAVPAVDTKEFPFHVPFYFNRKVTPTKIAKKEHNVCRITVFKIKAVEYKYDNKSTKVIVRDIIDKTDEIVRSCGIAEPEDMDMVMKTKDFGSAGTEIDEYTCSMGPKDKPCNGTGPLKSHLFWFLIAFQMIASLSSLM